MFWVVGEFFDDTKRLLGQPNCFEDRVLAENRVKEILSGQNKPHHVDYDIYEAENLEALARQGVLI